MSKPALYKKISAVMQDISYLSKDDKVEFNNTKYKAISEEKVTSSVRESLIRHGLVILPVKQAHKREGTLTTVDTEYKIVDIDTGDFEIIVSSGTGVDTQDKGVGKAMTYSYKYLLLRSFAIPTGEDPDKISSAELDAKAKEEEKKEIPASLKAKYQLLKGSLDGMEEWVAAQYSKGRKYPQMENILTGAIKKKEEQESAYSSCSYWPSHQGPRATIYPIRNGRCAVYTCRQSIIFPGRRTRGRFYPDRRMEKSGRGLR